MSPDASPIRTNQNATSAKRTRRAAVAVTVPLLILAVITLPAPGAMAHCEEDTDASLITLPVVGSTPSTCPYNEDVEGLVEAWNEAGGREQVFILVKDQTFHPPIVEVKSGGTVTFVYADVEWDEEHDLKSSGRCSNWWIDPTENPGDCIPSNPGKCFDVNRDQGGNFKSLGETYPLTFRYVSTDNAIEKSNGFQTGGPVGDLTGAEPFRECPPGTGYTDMTTGTIPFHCSLHGGADTDPDHMRGTIIVVDE